MRNSDVNGARTRLGAVWFALAEDYLRKRIDSGESKETDVVSIVLMGEKAKVLVEHEPTDWCLYNEICRIYNHNFVVPRGHGCYVPALQMAEEILSRNNSHSCALNLTFLSDGRPSDNYVFKHDSYNYSIKTIQEKIGSLASKLGRRLTVATIGECNKNLTVETILIHSFPGIGSFEDFETLENMAKLAEDYGSVGLFQLPSLSCSKLGNAFTTISTAVAMTKIFNDIATIIITIIVTLTKTTTKTTTIIKTKQHLSL